VGETYINSNNFSMNNITFFSNFEVSKDKKFQAYESKNASVPAPIRHPMVLELW